VREGKSAGITYLVCGVLVLLFSASSVLDPNELSQYRTIRQPWLYQYGAGTVGVVLGLLLLVAGIAALRHEAPPHSPSALIFEYEPLTAFGLIFGIPCILFAVVCLTAILPYTAERGIVPGQIGAALFLFLMMTGCAWVFLHYRRLAIIDPDARTFEIRYGKPWIVKRSRFTFEDFESVSIQKIARKRGYV
jgi:hypothetical protein